MKKSQVSSIKPQVPRNTTSVRQKYGLSQSRAVSWNLVLGIWFLGLSICSAQQNKIDSLLSLLKKDKEDTNKVNHLNVLARELGSTNPDTSILLSTQALQLSEKQNWKKGVARSFHELGWFYTVKSDYSKALDCNFKALAIWEKLEKNPDSQNPKSLILNRKSSTLGNIGIVYLYQGDYLKALDNYLKALKIDEELKDKNGIAKRLGNIGNVYNSQADYPKALDYYFKALKMSEELGNKNNITAWVGNIGIVYYQQGDYPKALDYYLKALKMAEELGDKNAIARHLGNIGIVCMEQAGAVKSRCGAIRSDSLYKEALDYYFKALKIDEELGNKNGIARHLGNIGVVYEQQNDYPKALDYYFKALKMDEELGRKSGIAADLGNIGSLFTRTGKFKEAEVYLKKAIAIDSAIDAKYELMQFEELLSQLYDTTGRHKLALIHYKKTMALKDTLFSEEKNKEITRKEMNYEFEKKEAAAKAESDKQAAVAEAERKKQSLVIWSLVVGALLVVVFAGFIYRALRITQKQKKVIEEQKRIVEEKQKEILDSIRYAKRIQDAILPKEKYIDKCFKRLMKKSVDN